MSKRKSTRTVVVMMAVIAFVLPVSIWAGGQEEAPAAAADAEWGQFQGQSIHVLLTEHPATEVIERRIPEFEELTGIQVELEVLTESQHRLKRYTEFLSGRSSIDVFQTQVDQEGLQYVEQGWYYPIMDLVEDEALTFDDYDFEGFGAGSVGKASIDGNVYGVPLNATSTMFYYNQEIFDEFGLEPPTTWDEVEENARAVYEGSNGEISGLTMRGAGSATTTYFAPVLYTFGGAWEDENGRPTLNTPEAIAAADTYGRILGNYGPDGVLGHSWAEVISLFMEERAAMMMESSAFIGDVEDPDESHAAGKIGYVPIPAAEPGGEQIPRLGGWEMAIYGETDRPGPAWYFVQYMTNLDAAVQFLLEADLELGRPGVWDTQRVQDELGSPEWGQVLGFNSTHGAALGAAPPSIPQIAEAREIIGELVVAAIEREDVEAAANEAQRGLEALLD